MPAAPTTLSLALGARARLAAQRPGIDRINVFPVADGDTGSNMLATADAVVAALRELPADPARAAGDAALLGARGNSGTILSAMARAACDALAAAPAIDGAAVAGALRAAADAGYRAVPEPVEGTMLTVARAMAVATAGDDARSALAAALAGGREALAATERQMEALRDAGVVDAGAAGLVALVEGMLAVLDGEEVEDAPAAALAPEVHLHDPTSRFRHCIGFVVRAAGADIDVEALRVGAAELGDSVVVVGDARLARVHVHADDPDAAVAWASGHGAVEALAVSDMRAQIAERVAAERVGGVAIVYDSTADLPVPDRATWTMIPLTVHFGDEEFRDYVDLRPDEFYARLPGAAVMPRTSQPSPGAFAAVYRELLERHDHVLSVHISSRLSGTCASALAAASEFDGRVTVADTRMVSALLALGVERAQRSLDAGVPPEELPALLAGLAERSSCVFSVPTLEYLQRNGRVGRASAMVGGLLGVQPILAIEDGEVVPARKVRGEGNLLPAMVEELVARSAGQGPIDVAIAHAEDPGRAAALEALVRDAHPDVRSLRVLTLGAVIGAHTGPGALGLAHMPVDG
jgi:DegV family protein with EDD domain